MFNTKVFIQPEDVYQYFLEHKKELEDNMHIIASTDIDDFDKKSFLFMTNNDGDLFLSLEAPDTIVDSEYCFEYDTEESVNKFLEKLDKLTPIVLKYTYSDSRYVRYAPSVITRELDKYLNQSFLCTIKDETGIYEISIYDTLRGSIGDIYLNEDDIITKVFIYELTKSTVKELAKIEKELLGYKIIIK